MLMSDVNLKSYSDTSYHNEELKSLTRYRFDKVKERAKLKTSVSRLVCILFPELEKLVPTLHMVCFNSSDFAGIFEPIEVLAASLNAMAVSLPYRPFEASERRLVNLVR